MNDKAILYESEKKSPIVAMILNLVLPGAGYIYCGHWSLGFAVLLVTFLALLFTLGFAALVIYPILIIDGVLVANRYNKKLASRLVG